MMKLDNIKINEFEIVAKPQNSLELHLINIWQDKNIEVIKSEYNDRIIIRFTHKIDKKDEPTGIGALF